MTGPLPIACPYIFWKTSSAALRCDSASILFSSPYDSRSDTEVTGTPGFTIARGSPLPKFTAVSTFSLCGSRSCIALPSQPSVATSSGSQVCQMSIERKCERFGFG